MHDQNHGLTPVPSENHALHAFHEQQRGIRLDPLTKARRNPASLRLAINAKCYDCSGQDCDPGWHDRIRHCAVPGCPLYPVRPFQQGEADE